MERKWRIHAISNLNTFEIDSIIINIIFSTSKRYPIIYEQR